jgi:hypothetical protein
MSSDYDHDHCRTTQVKRQRHSGPYAHASRDGSVDLWEGRGEIRSLDHNYSFANPRFMLEICNGFYDDHTAKHTQIEMEGGQAHLYGGSSWVEGFVRGDGGRDLEDQSPLYSRETWYFDAAGELDSDDPEKVDSVDASVDS